MEPKSAFADSTFVSRQAAIGKRQSASFRHRRVVKERLALQVPEEAAQVDGCFVLVSCVREGMRPSGSETTSDTPPNQLLALHQGAMPWVLGRYS